MIEQFSHVYLRQSSLYEKLAAAGQQPQAGPSALAFFAAKSSAQISAAPTDRVGRRPKNGKHGLQSTAVSHEHAPAPEAGEREHRTEALRQLCDSLGQY